MSKLGFREFALGAALALQSNPVGAEKQKIDEGTVRARCTVVAEAARRTLAEFLDSFEIRTGGTAFAPLHAAERAEKECLEPYGFKPKPPKSAKARK